MNPLKTFCCLTLLSPYLLATTACKDANNLSEPAPQTKTESKEETKTEANTSEPQTIHSIASDIQNHADKDAISASLFPQMRPLVQITKKNLSTADIDAATKKYITEKYTPMFIANFGQMFANMQQNKKDFTDCAKPEAFNPQEDFKQALCLTETDTGATATHFSAYQSAPLEETVTFIFKKEANGIKMVDVKLPTSKPAAYFVEGVS